MAKKYQVVLTSWGNTREVMFSNVSYKEALDFCEDNDWTWDAGYIWDLEIEEM